VCLYVVASGPVADFAAYEFGSDHVRIEWLPPNEPNGIIVSYAVFCRPSMCNSTVRCFIGLITLAHNQAVLRGSRKLSHVLPATQ
jgi:hypothetical protein